jgi:hypothetical protein
VDFVRADPGHAEVAWVEEFGEPPEGLSGFAVR